MSLAFIFQLMAATLLWPRKSSDITMKVEVSPQRWEPKRHGSSKIKFAVELYNATNEEKSVCIYSQPQIIFCKGSRFVCSEGFQDMPRAIDDSDIVTLQPHKAFIYFFDGTLRCEANRMVLMGGDEETDFFWFLPLHPGVYKARLVLNSFIPPTIPNKIDLALRANIWKGKAVSTAQEIVVNL
jgi:hypothetical protein